MIIRCHADMPHGIVPLSATPGDQDSSMQAARVCCVIVQYD